MSNFMQALNQGLTAAKQAQESRKEIEGILAELNAELDRLADGKVELAIVPIEQTMNAFSRLALSFDPKAKSQQVLAVRPKRGEGYIPRMIARWTQGEAGYPCTISYEDRQATCADAEALTHELEQLVSTPSVGEAIIAAMDYKSLATP